MMAYGWMPTMNKGKMIISEIVGSKKSTQRLLVK